MIIDVNVSLARWPFRRLAGDEPATLVAKLRRRTSHRPGGQLRGYPHKDLAGVNAGLRRTAAATVQACSYLLVHQSQFPIGRRTCGAARRAQMPGIGCIPTITDTSSMIQPFASSEASADRKLIVQLALCMEDDARSIL